MKNLGDSYSCVLPINNNGETFILWLEQADRLPGNRIVGSVADPRCVLLLRKAWISCEDPVSFKRKPIKIMSESLSNILSSFARGEISETCFSHLLVLHVLDITETSRLFLH